MSARRRRLLLAALICIVAATLVFLSIDGSVQYRGFWLALESLVVLATSGLFMLLSRPPRRQWSTWILVYVLVLLAGFLLAGLIFAKKHVA
jgi:hypothetical protein